MVPKLAISSVACFNRPTILCWVYVWNNTATTPTTITKLPVVLNANVLFIFVPSFDFSKTVLIFCSESRERVSFVQLLREEDIFCKSLKYFWHSGHFER